MHLHLQPWSWEAKSHLDRVITGPKNFKASCRQVSSMPKMDVVADDAHGGQEGDTEEGRPCYGQWSAAVLEENRKKDFFSAGVP